jgi:hypothetical protein
VSHEQAQAAGEAQAKKWAAVTHEKILHVKKLHAAGWKAGDVSKDTGIAPSTIHSIVTGLTKKYAETGPRSAAMKALIGVTDEQWAAVKKAGDDQLKQYGKIDFHKVAEQAGVKHWKATAVYFQKKKGQP